MKVRRKAVIDYRPGTMGAMAVFPPTVVFVHGAWQNADCWVAVQSLLTGRGIRSVAVSLPSTDPGRSLPGFGDDVDAVLDVVDGVEGPVTLCGHGYGGMVISEAGNHGRVARLIYLAAVCPRPGERMIDHVRRLPRWLRLTGDGRMVLTPKAGARRFYGDLRPRSASALASHLLPSTAAIVRARSVSPAWLSTPTTYVTCARDRMLDRDRTKQAADLIMVHQLGQGRADGYDVTLPTGHSPFYSAPEQVADVVSDPRRVNGYPKR